MHDGLYLNTTRSRRVWRRSKSARHVLSQRNDLVGLTFKSYEQCKKAIAHIRKIRLGYPYDIEKHVIFTRLIVPKKAVGHINGFIAHNSVISREKLADFVKKNKNRGKARWHTSAHSHALEIILQYKYFLKDYVISHIGLFAEAFAQKKDSAKIH